MYEGSRKLGGRWRGLVPSDVGTGMGMVRREGAEDCGNLGSERT